MFVLRVLLVLEHMYCSYSQSRGTWTISTAHTPNIPEYLGRQYSKHAQYSEYDIEYTRRNCATVDTQMAFRRYYPGRYFSSLGTPVIHCGISLYTIAWLLTVAWFFFLLLSRVETVCLLWSIGLRPALRRARRCGECPWRLSTLTRPSPRSPT